MTRYLRAATVIASFILILSVQPSSPDQRVGRPLKIGQSQRFFATDKSLHHLTGFKFPKSLFKKFSLTRTVVTRPEEDDTGSIPGDSAISLNEINRDEDNFDSKYKMEEERNADDPLLFLLDSYPQLTDSEWDQNAPNPRHETMTDSGTSQWNDRQENQSENTEIVPAEMPKIGSGDSRKKRAAIVMHPHPTYPKPHPGYLKSNPGHPKPNPDRCRLFNQLCPSSYYLIYRGKNKKIESRNHKN